MFSDAELCEALSSSMVRRYALYLTRDIEKRNDLLQETALRVLEKRDLWEPGSSLVRWINTIMLRLWYDELRRRKRFPAFEEFPENLAHHPDPEAAIAAKEALVHAFGSLTPRYRRAIIDFAEGESLSEIAHREGAIKSSMHSRRTKARNAVMRSIGVRHI